MSRGKQSVRKGVWYITANIKEHLKEKNKKRGAIPFGLIASLAAPVLEEVAKPIFKKILGRGRRKRKW